MSDPVSTARSARENLRQGLAALQAPGVPLAVTQAAEPVAQAMGALHQIEASGGAGLAQHAPVALEAVRRALGMLQGQPATVPAVSQALEAVAGSLSLVHQLSQSVMVNAATQRQQPSPMAAQPQYQAPAMGYGATVAQAPVPQAPQQFAQPQGYPPQAPGYPAAQPPGFPQAAPQYPQAAQYPPQQQPQYAQPAPTAAQPQYAAQHPPAAQPQYAQQPPAQHPPAGQPQYAQQPPQGFAPPPQAHAPPQAAYAPQPPAPQYAPPGAEAAQQWPQRVSTVPPPPGGAAMTVEAELGAHSATNFYKGLSGNDVIDSGGIFIATYQIPELGQPLTIKVSLPGGYEFEAAGVVRWTREAPHSTRGVESPPGFGAQFTNISQEGRQLVYRYVRNREPLFHDDL